MCFRTGLYYTYVRAHCSIYIFGGPSGQQGERVRGPTTSCQRTTGLRRDCVWEGLGPGKGSKQGATRRPESKVQRGSCKEGFRE